MVVSITNNTSIKPFGTRFEPCVSPCTKHLSQTKDVERHTLCPARAGHLGVGWALITVPLVAVIVTMARTEHLDSTGKGC